MKTSSSRIRGFSLLELIVVILIIGIVATFVVPATSTILRGSQMTQGSQILTDQFSLARQQALTKNRSVEVRLINYKDPEVPGDTGNYRAIQVMEVLESGAVVPLDKPQLLPQSVVLDDTITLSTLIKDSDVSSQTAGTNDPKLGRNIEQNYTYKAFRFLPDGSTNLKPAKIWFVTLRNQNDTSAVPPANFFTLQVDPVSGVTKTYRPGV